MRVKTIAVGLIMLLLLTGCQNDNSNSNSQMTLESFRSRGGESMSRRISVYVGEDNLLHMYDPGQSDTIVLCNKADCSHEPYDERDNPDPTCNAALNKELFSCCVPVISGDYLYLFGQENMSRGVVYRENLDGTGRTRVFTMDYQVGMGNSVYVTNNIVYAEAGIPIITEDNLGGAGTNSSYDMLLRIDLQSGETKEISPISKEKFQNIDLLERKGDQLYYSFSYRTLSEGDDDYSTAPEHYSIYCYDLKTNKQTQLFTEDELEGLTPVGMTESSLCTFSKDTGEAFEISMKDKSRKSIYQPPEHNAIYFMYNNRWIIGDMDKEEFSYLEGKELKVLEDIVSFSNTFGNYAEFYKKDGTCQAVYGSSLFTEEKEIILERK